MTTSGLDSWLPTIGEILDEALEYAGIDPATANARHLKSALRSMNQVYMWLENDREALFRDDIETINTELILADLQTIEKALPAWRRRRRSRAARRGRRRREGRRRAAQRRVDHRPRPGVDQVHAPVL